MRDSCVRWASSDSIGRGGVHADRRQGVVCFLRERTREEGRSSAMTNARGARTLATAVTAAGRGHVVCRRRQRSCGEREPHSEFAGPDHSDHRPPPSETEIASEAASAVLRKYYDVRTAPSGPDASARRCSRVAISTQLAAQQNLFKSQRKRDCTRSATPRSPSSRCSRSTSTTPTRRPARSPRSRSTSATTSARWTLSTRTASPSSAPTGPTPAGFVPGRRTTSWNADPTGGWRVATSQDLERTPCAAS